MLRRLIPALAVVLLLAGCSTSSPAPTPSRARTWHIASVVGDTAADAKTDLKYVGLRVAFTYDTLPFGQAPADVDLTHYKVESQDVPAGSLVSVGVTVNLHVVSMTVTVPDETGQTYIAAQAGLVTAGLTDSTNGPAEATLWKVTGQTPSAGATVPRGTGVTLTLAQPQIVFSVTGDGSDASTITWSIPGTFNITQATNAALPWSQSFPYNGTTSSYGNLSAQDDDGSTITCTITADGRVVSQITATGDYAIASCNP